jgi:DNA polymerase III delta prime subunit
MSKIIDLPSLYNPAEMTELDLIESFVIRKKQYNEIYSSIKQADMKHPEQHYIIQGQRGSGKTTLLLRLFYEVKNDSKLNKWLIPVIFNEEQYNIHNLSTFWEEIARYLDEEKDFHGISKQMDHSWGNEDFERNCFNILIEYLNQNNKKIIVFVDNFGILLNRFDNKDHHRIREVLLKCPDIRIIGASTMIMELFYDYSKPFFDFFSFIHLDSLNEEETVSLMTALGKKYKQKEIQTIIKIDRNKIEALRRLTGGIPRTIVLLYEIFIDENGGSSFKYLEALLDRVTPLYKHRMDDLPSQQQKIVHDIALNWDAISVKELSQKTRMPSKIISSQLSLLVKNSIVQKIKTNTKNHLYILSERFFNIWYLIRCGRHENKKKVKWLTQFLEIWCDDNELENRAKKHIESLKSGNIYPGYANHFSEALIATKLNNKIKHEVNEARTEYTTTNNQVKKTEHNEFDVNIENLKSEADNGNSEAMLNLALLYENEFNDFKNAEKYYKSAAENGVSEAMFNIAMLYQFEYNDFENAKKYYTMATESGESRAMSYLALLYQFEYNNFKKAEKYYKMAIENADLNAMNGLAYLYYTSNKNAKVALKYTEKLYFRDNNAFNSHSYAITLLWNNEIEEAIKISEGFINNKNMHDNNKNDVVEYFILTMAKKQYHYLYKIFNENSFELKDRYKPVYYALMNFLKDEYPNEYIKAGEDINETVNEIIEKVKKYESIYN